MTKRLKELLTFAVFTGAISFVTGVPTGHALSAIAAPVALDSDGFQEVLVQVGDVYISGQPTPEGIARLKSLGVSTVVNLRTAREMNSRAIVPFDEAQLLSELGMTYVHIPSGGPDTPYAPEMVDRFAEALAQAQGKVLLHCTVAWRASHLWTAYLTRYKGIALPLAVEHARQINLGKIPLEGFLGEDLVFEKPR